MKKANKEKTIYVYADWSELTQPTLFGTLHVVASRGKETFAFEYNDDWLKKQTNALDPTLQFFSGRQYHPVDQNNFGLFLDSSPDRWGRILMDRREAETARREKRMENTLLESDYLLGVFDEHRMGALRFRLDPHGSFLDDNKLFASPPWTSLKELEQASLGLEKNHATQNKNYSKWLNMLIIPGSSLGGARPKASIIDEHKNLWIAKFPSAHDKYDVGAWELLVNNLASRANILTAPAKIKKLNVRHHTFLTKRFDRLKDKRMHFASAITLLQRRDGDNAEKGASYLELATFIIKNGMEPAKDLEQLWRRIVFFISVSNVDDHLRNHGFIFHPKGWVLSPAYDMNPVAPGDGLTLNISETDNSQDFSLALEVAKHFWITPNKAEEIILKTIQIVKGWRKEAKLLKISKHEQDHMARAFRLVE